MLRLNGIIELVCPNMANPVPPRQCGKLADYFPADAGDRAHFDRMNRMNRIGGKFLKILLILSKTSRQTPEAVTDEKTLTQRRKDAKPPRISFRNLASWRLAQASPVAVRKDRLWGAIAPNRG
jgi:hypothetical protein